MSVNDILFPIFLKYPLRILGLPAGGRNARGTDGKNSLHDFDMKNKLIVCLLCGLMSASFTAAKARFRRMAACAQGPSQMNSVFVTDRGRWSLLDGEPLRTRLFARIRGRPGQTASINGSSPIRMWIMGALTEILKDPRQNDYRHGLSVADDRRAAPHGHEPQKACGRLPIRSAPGFRSGKPEAEPGLEMKIDGMNLKVLGVAHPSILTNAYNNASIVLRVWDRKKSMVFLGDTGVESGKCCSKVLIKPLLDCDYLQNGASRPAGMRRAFYKSIRFRACLWPTPLWVWNNDVGRRFDTAYMKTIETRRWMDEIGITEHYISWQGIVKIEWEFAARAFGRFARRTAPF